MTERLIGPRTVAERCELSEAQAWRLLDLEVSAGNADVKDMGAPRLLSRRKPRRLLRITESGLDRLLQNRTAQPLEVQLRRRGVE